MNTLNPKWNEEFLFTVSPKEHKFVLKVYDFDNDYKATGKWVISSTSLLRYG